MLRALFLALSQSRRVQQAAVRWPVLRRAVRRFVAGETLPEAVEVIRRLADAGLGVAVDFLGEGVTSRALAEASARAYLDILDVLRQGRWDVYLSLKLTQLGLDVDETLCARLLRQILARASPLFVRVDMESSRYTDQTLGLVESLWRDGCRNVGTVIQAYLRRSAGDLERLLTLGVPVRLVKGAYREPPEVAFPRKRDVDANFARLAERLLLGGTRPAIATHDVRLIEHAIRFARAHGVPPDRFEFQMLYGVRRDLQIHLRDSGYRVRVYVPFGDQWYPYFMRRLAERPANVVFVLRSVLGERWRPARGDEGGGRSPDVR